MISHFEEKKLYSAHDSEMRLFGSVQLLAQWRCRGKGPAYTKIGRTPMYIGSDLNKFLNDRRVETGDSK